MHYCQKEDRRVVCMEYISTIQKGIFFGVYLGGIVPNIDSKCEGVFEGVWIKAPDKMTQLKWRAALPPTSSGYAPYEKGGLKIERKLWSVSVKRRYRANKEVSGRDERGQGAQPVTTDIYAKADW